MRLINLHQVAWTPEEEQLVRDYYPAADVGEVRRKLIALGTERTRRAIQAKASRLGVATGASIWYKQWVEDEIQIVAATYEQGSHAAQSALQREGFDATLAQIRSLAWRIGARFGEDYWTGKVLD